MILTPIAVDELVNLIACKVEERIHKTEYREQPQDNISLYEACIELGTKEKPASKAQLYKLTMLNEIPFQKFGKRLVFSRKAVREWKESRTVSPLKDTEIITGRISEAAKKHLKK